jgi:molybdopterin-containing oxidoreductase family membrane subunit
VLAGTIGFFVTLMFIFMRIVPAISIFEVREVIHHLPEEKHLAPSHIK